MGLTYSSVHKGGVFVALEREDVGCFTKTRDIDKTPCPDEGSDVVAGAHEAFEGVHDLN